MRRILFALALTTAAAPLAAQQPEKQPDRVINVNATGTVTREPEKAVITVAVESEGSNAQQAAQSNAGKMEAVFAALRRLGIVPPKVRTIAYELQPVYQQPDRDNPNVTPRIGGYRAVNMVQVDVDDVKRVGAIIDAVVSAGANRVANLSFELRDPEAARMEALRLAVAKARAEAEVLASAAGQRLGPPLSLTSSSHYQPRMYRDLAVAEMAAAAPTPIEAGSLTITATVSAVYRMEDR